MGVEVFYLKGRAFKIVFMPLERAQNVENTRWILGNDKQCILAWMYSTAKIRWNQKKKLDLGTVDFGFYFVPGPHITLITVLISRVMWSDLRSNKSDSWIYSLDRSEVGVLVI